MALSTTAAKQQRLANFAKEYGIGPLPPPPHLNKPKHPFSLRTRQDDLNAEDLLKRRHLAANPDSQGLQKRRRPKRPDWELSQVFEAHLSQDSSLLKVLAQAADPADGSAVISAVKSLKPDIVKALLPAKRFSTGVLSSAFTGAIKNFSKIDTQKHVRSSSACWRSRTCCVPGAHLIMILSRFF